MNKKHLRTIALMTLLCCVSMGFAVAEASEGLVIGDTVSIWQEANTASTELAVSNNGEILTILGEKYNWYHVRFDDETTGAHGEGYVLKRNLVVDPQYVTALGNTILFAVPSSDGKVVGEMMGGETLPVIGEWQNFWAVNLRTASAFVQKDAVDYSGVIQQATARPTTNPTATAVPEPPVSYANYVLLRDTALRSGPSMNAPSNGTMIAGSTVLIGRIQNGYGQSAENGFWLSMNDLQRAIPGVTAPIETSAPSTFQYLVINDGTSVYTQPDVTSDVVDTLNDGDSVMISTIQNGFGLAQYGRQRGWIEMSNLLSFHR